MSTIAFIGLGRMGLPMASHLMKAGHTLRAYDSAPQSVKRAEELGAIPTSSIAECVESAEIVITSLPDPVIVREVYLGSNGIIEKSSSGTILLDTSTSSPSLAREIESASNDKGIKALDTPVSGGPTGAEAGTLAVMVGGNNDVFNEVYENVLMQFGSQICRMGDAGAGQTTKLVNNLLAGVYMTAISEALVLAEREGLDYDALFKVLTNGTGNSTPLRTRFPIPGALETTPASNGWTPMFPVTLIRKDLLLAQERAEELGLNLQAVKYAISQYEGAIEQGWGDLDYSVISNLLRD